MLKIRLSIFTAIAALIAAALPSPAPVSSGQAVGPTHSNMIAEATVPMEPLPNTASLELDSNSQASSVPIIENVGQFDSQVRFQMHGQDQIIWLTTDAIWITFLSPTPTVGASQRNSEVLSAANASESMQDRPRGVNLKLTFVDANPHPQLEPFGRLDTRVSYFLGGESKQWRPDAPAWSGVRYRDVYPGVDLEITNHNGNIAQRMVALDSADLREVRLRVEGADRVSVSDDHVLFDTAMGQFEWPLFVTSAPDIYRFGKPMVMGDLIALPFAKTSEKPAIPAASSSGPILSTFLGGSANDSGKAIAVDSAGSIYLTGSTSSANFPTTPGVFDTSYGTSADVFIAKLNPAGTGLIYATFLGGSGGTESGEGIAVDGNGNAFITGYTPNCSDFPTTPGSLQTVSRKCGNYDAFVTKLNASGTGLVYSTFLSGFYADKGQGIQVDTAGNAYVVGLTVEWSGNSSFPTTPGAYDTGHNGGEDVFVVKINPTGSAALYATFVGGTSNDSAEAIAIDSAGNAYVTGKTTSSDFPVTAGAFDTSYGGNGDAFVVELNASGSARVYATFLGGSNADAASDIAVDSSGNAYLTGNTASPNFAYSPGAFDTTFNGGNDVFVVKLNSTGNSRLYGSFVGGGDNDMGFGLVLDNVGNAYIVGQTNSTDFPTTTTAYDGVLGGGICGTGTTYPCADVFLATLNASASDLLYGTYWGGSSDDIGNALAVDSTGLVFLTGETSSIDFPFSSTAFDTSPNGGSDAFVAKLDARQPLSTLIRIVNEQNIPVNGARLYVGDAFAGLTNASGEITVGLKSGFTLAATQLITEVATNKGGHSQDSTQNWDHRVYITSVPIDNDGNPTLHTVTIPGVTQLLTVSISNTLIGFNIVASAQWDASDSYLNSLEQAFAAASTYLYDASDGQMIFERVTLKENTHEDWMDANYQIRASTIQWPKQIGDFVELGRYFKDENSDAYYTWTDTVGSRTLTHEFGHHRLVLYDSYKKKTGEIWTEDGACTSPAIEDTSDTTNASLMYKQEFATEFSMKGVASLWSAECEQTQQWLEVSLHDGRHESDWDTIKRVYSDKNSSPHWLIRTPGDRGQLVAGPVTIPVTGWTRVYSLPVTSDPALCISDPVYNVQRAWGTPVAKADIWLKTKLGKIYQGQTDSHGSITILGASNGDKVLVEFWGHNADVLLNSAVVSCPSTQSPALHMPEDTVINLESSPFNVNVAAIPGKSAEQVEIEVAPSVNLTDVPEVRIRQSGAVTDSLILMTYNDVADIYTGTLILSSTLPSSGIIEIEARDVSNHVLDTYRTFSFQSLVSSQDSSLISSDGVAELYIPAGNVSTGGVAEVTYNRTTETPPDNLLVVGGPFNIVTSEGVSLVGVAGLTIAYLGPSSKYGRADLSSAQMYRWDKVTKGWQLVPSNIYDVRNSVTATIDQLGIYAVLAKRQYLVYLPTVLKK